MLFYFCLLTQSAIKKRRFFFVVVVLDSILGLFRNQERYKWQREKVNKTNIKPVGGLKWKPE